MIIILQIIVITAALTVMLTALGKRSTHSGRAWKKIALIMLGVSMIVAVLFPELTNYVAHLVGIGRGADLLLYATVVAFIFYALNSYLHQQDQRDSLYRLARRVAIIEAREKYIKETK